MTWFQPPGPIEPQSLPVRTITTFVFGDTKMYWPHNPIASKV